VLDYIEQARHGNRQERRHAVYLKAILMKCQEVRGRRMSKMKVFVDGWMKQSVEVWKMDGEAGV
jgi:hypothetical protein